MSEPTYDDLSRLVDELQEQVSRGLQLKRELMAARDALDRENTRYRIQHRLSERALAAATPSEIAMIALESLVEAFELEVAALFLCSEGGEVERLGTFGPFECPERLPFEQDWLADDNAIDLPRDHAIAEAWPDLGLDQLVLCRFCHHARPLLIAVGGITRTKARWFAKLGTADLAPFGAMVQHVGAIWVSHHLNATLRERRYNVLFHRSNDGILLVNPDGEIVDCNQRVLDMFGYGRDELVRMKVFDLSPAAERAAATQMFERLTTVGSLRFERECVRKDGSTFPAEVNASLFDVDDRFMLHGLVRDLTQEKRQQRLLIQSERMAALGQLTAGIAHEINTPVGVIQASTGNMEDALGRVLEKLPEVARSLDAADREAFFDLLERVRKPGTALTSREERAARRRIASALAEACGKDAEFIADRLVDAGLTDDAEPYASLLAKHPSLVTEAAYDLASIRRNHGGIRLAVERATKVVSALKKYVHRDFTEAVRPADLLDGIEVVLTLHQNQTKHGVEVVRRFEKLPPVECHVDELNQVWTNLVHNALQAMQFRGRLEIGARLLGDHVEVTVVDDGPGIPQAIIERVFEPFFTTKDVGDGSGLGLDISRRIVERHGGRIHVTSRPGRTIFTVTLPIRSPAAVSA